MTDPDPELRRVLAPLRAEASDADPGAGARGLSPAERARILGKMREQVRAVPELRRRAVRRRRMQAGTAFGAALVACSALFWTMRAPTALPVSSAVHLAAAGESPLSWTNPDGVARELRGELDLLDDGELRVPEQASALLTTSAGVRIEAAKQTFLRLDSRRRPRGQGILLERGAVRCRVPPLGRGQAFEVATASARVVVHGTDFSVALDSPDAVDRKLPCVRVREGLVEVQRAGAASVWLGPGQEWGCIEAVAAADARASALPVVAGPSANDPSFADRAAHGGKSSVRVHHRGRHLRDRSAEQAESAEPELASPIASSTLRQENQLLASALRAERAGDEARARTLFGKLLERFPQSPLAPEAKAGLIRTRDTAD